ncbi:MAG: hypothetical protein RMK89_11855 [Armatimonadota bacterium]|nr:hypothetical protein [Armatimonadota bacterium]MDW8144143.1 hypothetical protein [Armatimonadota bacterium]
MYHGRQEKGTVSVTARPHADEKLAAQEKSARQDEGKVVGLCLERANDGF